MQAGRAAAIYTLLAALFSVPFWIMASRGGIHSVAIVLPLMWAPAAAAFVAAPLTGRRIRDFGWRWPGFGYMAAGYCIPLAYAVAAYAAVWALGLGRLDVQHYAALAHRPATQAIPLVATVGIAFGCVAALGEEIGWRGFLVPVLAERFSFRATSVISGVIWTAWHVPVILFSDYNNGTPAWWDVLCFTVAVIGVAFIMAWLRLASCSLWPCVLLHSAHNGFVQEVLTPLTANTGHTAWYIDEFGLFLPLAITVAALLTLRRAGLPHPT